MNIKPKQYTHIDYEALLIYVMKNKTSVSKAIEEFDLNVARSTVVRYISKEKKKAGKHEIIDLYSNEYVPNMQKSELPPKIQEKIDKLEERYIMKKDKIYDLYAKLVYIQRIVNACDGNVAEATRIINTGRTELGPSIITVQGLKKTLSRFPEVEKAWKEAKENDKMKKYNKYIDSIKKQENLEKNGEENMETPLNIRRFNHKTKRGNVARSVGQYIPNNAKSQNEKIDNSKIRGNIARSAGRCTDIKYVDGLDFDDEER